MAKGQVKKASVKIPSKTEVQADNMIFALDIGTRSIIGMVGVVEEDKVKIIAIEREEHTERAMIDGQIENIEKVSMLAKKVKKRLEAKLHVRLKRVCVAAAGRALRTSRVDYEMELPGTQLIDDELINRLEAGAISKAEEIFDAENEVQEDSRRFYLVGYTVCQYFLDEYLISSLKEHRGKHIKVDLIATFLPSEVVESLYTTMNKTGLEVASITLEPIAAINAAIPESLRLLNLVMVDIGAGTSDIAACTGGSVTGYTMATVAGDEVTEAVMKEFLVDFKTAEAMKAQIEREEQVAFTDILGFERKVSRDEVLRCIQSITSLLSEEISEKVLAVNGAPPSALFLAGGGSKLAGLKEGITAALKMDSNRVAIAGNNFRTNALSDEYDLNNPEYATPLGIVISSGLNLINDSFRVSLNNKSAKLFRSGSFTVMNLLMMNGYSFQDMLGRPGRPVSVMVNGKRKVFYGTAAQPASLFINKREGKLSDIVRAGDNIEFVPAVSGVSANPYLGDIEGAPDCEEITLNGEMADLETPLKNGDVIRIILSEEQIAEKERQEREELEKEAVLSAERAAVKEEESLSEEELSKEEIPQDMSVTTVEEQKETSGRKKNLTIEKDALTVKEQPRVEEFLKPEQPIAEKLQDEQLTIEEMPKAEAPKKMEHPIAEELKKAEQTTVEEEELREVEQSTVEEEVSPVRTQVQRDIPMERKASARKETILFQLNGSPIRLPRKQDGTPYYLMDMIEHSGIDLKQPKGKVILSVNGAPGTFQQRLFAGDIIRIEEEI